VSGIPGKKGYPSRCGLAPGLLGFGLDSPLANGPAWRLPSRRAAWSWRRRRSFSACRSWARRLSVWQLAQKAGPIPVLYAGARRAASPMADRT
jgi:hypothetical protein